jgi:hypothetical protein
MKTNLLLFLFALSLAVSAYLDRRTTQPPVNAAKAATSNELLLTFSSDDPITVRVTDQQHCVVLRKELGGAAAAVTARLLDALRQVRIVRHLPPDSSDLSVYGLTSTARRIEILDANEKRLHGFLVGNSNPVGNAVYVRAPDRSEILLVGVYFLTVLDFALQHATSQENADPACVEFRRKFATQWYGE